MSGRPRFVSGTGPDYLSKYQPRDICRHVTVVELVPRRGPRAETRTSHNRPLHTSGAHTRLVANVGAVAPPLLPRDTARCGEGYTLGFGRVRTWRVAAAPPLSRSIGRNGAAPTSHALTPSLLGPHLLDRHKCLSSRMRPLE